MGVVNNALNGLTVIDGVSQANSVLQGKDPNPYDNILNTKITKVKKDQNGVNNALNSGNPMYSAAEYIDNEFYKEAKVSDVFNKIKNSNFVKNVANNKNKFVKNITELDGKLANGTKKEKLKAGLLIGVPTTAIEGGALYGTHKILKNSENKKSEKDRSTSYPYILPGIVGGALAFDAIKNKSFLHHITNNSSDMKNTLMKIPLNNLKKSGNTGKFVSAVGKKIINDANEEIREAEKTKRKVIKKASDIIDECYIEKAAGIQVNPKVGSKKYMKNLFVKDFLQEGIAGVGYLALPAAVSATTGRDIKHGGRRVRDTYDNSITVDVPENKLKNIPKTAGMKEPTPWKDFVKYDMPSRAMQGLGRGAFATGAVMLTKRNVTNAFEKVNDNNNNSAPIKDGYVRVTIKTSKPKDETEKKASEQIDTMFKSATLQNKNLEENISEDIDKIENNVKVKKTNLRNGIKKRNKLLV